MKKKKYQENPRPKKDYEKKKYWEDPEQKRGYEKNKFMDNLLRIRKYEKNKYEENPEPKRKFEKSKYEENPEPKREYEKSKYEGNPELKTEYEKIKYKEYPEPKREYEKNKYDKNPEPKKENRKKMYKKNKKCLNKLKKFCQQMRSVPYFICTVCHRCPYKRSVRLFEHKTYILTAELYCLVRSVNDKTYICDTCHKHLSRNEMPYQAVFNKMSLDPIPDELKDLKELEKKKNFQENNI